jgi:integrase
MADSNDTTSTADADNWNPNKRKLTDKFLQLIKPSPPGKRPVIWDTQTANLGIRITDRGVRTFVLMRRLPGHKNPIRVTLGRYPDMTLAAARDEADGAKQLIKKGTSPREEKKRIEREAAEEKERLRLEEVRKNTGSFANVAETFIKKHVIGPNPTKPRLRSARDMENTIRRDLISRWGAKPIVEISRRDVRELIEGIIDDKKRTTRGDVCHAAFHAFSYARKIFNWAISTDDYGLEANPCSRVNIEEEVGGSKQARDRILTDDEIRLLWRVTGSEIGYPLGPMLRMLLLSACRLREVAHCEWSEIINVAESTAGPLLVIPARRMKGTNKKAVEHAVPLVPAMLDIIAGLPRFQDAVFVFSTCDGQRPISGFSKLKRRLDAAMRAHEPDLQPFVLHDLRRTARSLMSRAGVDADHAERCLAHRIGGVRGVYDRHSFVKEKRAALEALAPLIERIVHTTDNAVVPMTRKAQPIPA